MSDGFDRTSLWRYRAMPLRVIDGDTLVVLCDTGFRGRHEAHIRIAGLNAPELHQEGGIDARRALDAVIFDRTVHMEWPLRIISQQRETVVSETRSFERYVADVYVVCGDGLRDVKDMLG